MTAPVFRKCLPILLAASLVGIAPPGRAGLGDLINKVNPFSSHSENPIEPYVGTAGEADFPCNGATIRPDSSGNFNFTFTPAKGAGITGYDIQFSKGGMGSGWNDAINGAMKLSDLKGPTVPVNAGTLLLASKNWYWRVSTKLGAGKPGTVGKRFCKFAIEPSGGAQALTAPILVSPVCNSNIPGGTVLFDAKPGAGKFQIFRAELQYNPAVGTALGTWHASTLLTVVDKTNPGSKFGVAVPVQTLSNSGARWRWRARLYNEKMPLFGNSTTGTWSPWCQFTVPSHTAQLKGGTATFQSMNPPLVPPQSGTQRSTSSAPANSRVPAVQHR